MKKLLILALACAYGSSIYAMENEEAKDSGLIKQPAKKGKELTYEQKLYKEFKKNIKHRHDTRLKKAIHVSESNKIFFNKDQKINLAAYAETIKLQESARANISFVNSMRIVPKQSSPGVGNPYRNREPQEAYADPKIIKRFEKSCKVLLLIENLKTK